MSGIALLTQSVKEAVSFVKSQPAEWTAKINSLKSSADSQIKASASAMESATIAYYNGDTHNKSSLGAKSSSTNPHESGWIAVPNKGGNHIFHPNENDLIKVHFRGAFAFEPGYYEKPTSYAKDWSRTSMQFIYANDSATSEEINDLIEEQGLTLNNAGGWWYGVISYKTVGVKVSGKAAASRLYVRFVNRSVVSGNHPQDIIRFGGNSSFSVNHIEYIPALKFKKV